MKRLIMLYIISALSSSAMSESTRPDYGKIAVKGMVDGMKTPFRTMPKAIELLSNEILGTTPKSKTWRKTVTCDKEGKKCKTLYSD
jgi:hypothetical protein